MEIPGNSTCTVIRSQTEYRGKQGLDYGAAISAESVGAKGICMHLVAIPPSARATAHLHEHHETAIYVLTGDAGMWYGPKLEHHLTATAGEFLYIPAGMPHLPYNPSATTPCTGVLARTDPNEQESVVVLRELEKFIPPTAPPPANKPDHAN